MDYKIPGYIESLGVQIDKINIYHLNSKQTLLSILIKLAVLKVLFIQHNQYNIYI